MNRHHEINKLITDVRNTKNETPVPDNPGSYLNFITNFDASQLQLLNGESGGNSSSGGGNGQTGGSYTGGRSLDPSRAIKNEAHNK